MSDRPTPETDYEQKIDNGDTVPLFEFARRLERERDEARELARQMRVHLMNLVDYEPCGCCHNDDAETDWAEAKLLIAKAKEVLP